MNDLVLFDITGSGGKKPPAQHVPVEYPDTGSSTQVAKLLLMISEGEIEGFSASDVFLKQVPSTEYSVDVESRNGLSNQTTISGFSEVYVPLTAASSEIKHGDLIGKHAIIAIPNIHDAVILTQSINALYKVETNGDTVANEVTLDYWVSNGTSYVWQKKKTISAKYSSGYAFGVTVTRPSGIIGNVWYAKIVRDTPDSTSNKDAKTTNFSQAVAITYKTLAYKRKALLSLILRDAKQFGGSIPEIIVRARGIKVDVPNNYNPSLDGGGSYTGTWLGVFSTLRQYTSNPAWCLLHCLTDSYTGLGLDYDSIDVFEFYALAMYCDELVNIDDISVSISSLPNETATLLSRVGDVFTIDNTATPTAASYLVYGNVGAFTAPDGTGIGTVNVQQGDTTVTTIVVGSYTHFRVEAVVQATAGTNTVGRQEPRYTINAQFITRENLSTFFMYFLSLMNANWTTNEFGQLSLMWDRAGQPVTKQVTNATVVDGIFNYSSTDIEQRFNHVNVTFSDPAAFGRTNTVSVPEVDTNGVGLTSIDNAAILAQTRYGFQQLDLVLVGCTSKAQAYRKARWALYNSVFIYDIIDFSVLLEGLTYRVGEVISICDNFNQDELISGIILSHELIGGFYHIVFDRELIFETSVEYSLTYLSKVDGSPITINLTPSATISYIDIAELDIFEPLDSSFIVHKTSVTPKLYKVIKLVKEEGELYKVIAIEHHETVVSIPDEANTLTKYNYVNNTVSLTHATGDFSNIQNETILPIVSGSIVVTPRYAIDEVSGELIRSLEITWTPPANPISLNGSIENRIFSYSVGITAPKTNIDVVVPTASYTIEKAELGTYKISVAIIDTTNSRSSPIETLVPDYLFSTSGDSTLLPPINLFVKDTTSVSFQTSDVMIHWDYDLGNDSVEDSLFSYQIRYLTTAGVILKDFTTIEYKSDKSGEVTIGYSIAKALEIVPPRSTKLEVYSLDALGRLSIAEVKTFTKVAPPAPNFTYTDNGSSITFVITSVTGYGVAQYKVYANNTTGFTPTDTDLVKTINLDPAVEPLAYSIVDIAYPSWAVAGQPIFFKVESLDGYLT